ncbi:hypothetical protein DFQ30_008907 [Apophysomyces sp. BC1015]|nr:hypothetical protein DFQ30_008907 [Apophysomyces sp. BC1015]
MEGTATVSRDGNLIYHIGGIDAHHQRPALMTDIFIFDTVWLVWKINNATGVRLPSSRVYHTAVQLPDSDSILIYGGAVPANFDINTAVLYGNHSMFILFGVDHNGSEHNDFHVMDLTRFQWTNIFHADVQHSESSTKLPTPMLESQRLAGGTIAGIVVGSIIGVAVIAAIAAFLLIRKERQQRGRATDNELSRLQNPGIAQELFTSSKEAPSEYHNTNRESQRFSYLDASNQKSEIPALTPRLVMSPVECSAGDYDIGSCKPHGHIIRFSSGSTKPEGI